MSNENKEGAQRPLTTRAPIPQGAAWAAVAGYGIAYLYVYAFFAPPSRSFGPLGVLFSVLLVAGVDAFCRANQRAPGRESLFWGVCYLLQSVALAVYGWWPGDLSLWQGLAWHGCAVWFVLARTGMAAAGRSGIFTPLDGLNGFILLPFGGFFLRIMALGEAVVRRLRTAGSRKGNVRVILTVLGSCLLALVLALYAWAQLCAADAQFAALGGELSALLDRLFLNNERVVEIFVRFVLSLPVGAWLFGLAANGLRRKAPPIPAGAFCRTIQPLAVVPVYALGIVVGTLCCLYTLFFWVQAAGLLGVFARPALTAPEASTLAVQGFWELCRVQLLNFGVLLTARFLVPGLREKAATRAALGVFCGFGFAFATLALGKLGLYITQFGLTPRRVVSAWFSVVLGVWALLALVWCVAPERKIPAARWGVLVLAASFTVLCLCGIVGMGAV